MKRATVIETLNDLPKEFVLDQLLERLIVIEKIQEGLDDVKNGKTVDLSEVRKMTKLFGN